MWFSVINRSSERLFADYYSTFVSKTAKSLFNFIVRIQALEEMNNMIVTNEKVKDFVCTGRGKNGRQTNES